MAKRPFSDVTDPALEEILKTESDYLAGRVTQEQYDIAYRKFDSFLYTWNDDRALALWKELTTSPKELMVKEPPALRACGFSLIGCKGNHDTLVRCQKFGYLKDVYMKRELNCRQKTSYGVGLATEFRVSTCPKHRNVWHLQLKKTLTKNQAFYAFVDVLFPFSCNLDKDRTSVYFSKVLADVASTPDGVEKANAVLSRLPIGSYNMAASAWLLMAVGNPRFDLAVKICDRFELCCLSSDDYIRKWKIASTAIKRSRRLYDGTELTTADLGFIVGIEGVQGRGVHIAPHDEEREKRCTESKPLVDISPKETTVDVLRRMTREIIDKLISSKSSRIDWAEHIRTRARWAAGGSSGGLKFYDAKGKLRTLNKRAALELIPTEKLLQLLETAPIIIAKMTQKMEPSKARALYPTLLEDYIIVAYLLDQIEPNLGDLDEFEYGYSGLAALNASYRRMCDLSGHGAEAFMLDYTDFNAQHTLDAQAMVFEELRGAMEHRHWHPDYLTACDWVAKACLNQFVIFPTHSEEKIQVKQGMFSGVRFTNFVNTVLNLAYFNTAAHFVATLDGVESRGHRNIHQGDDVWIVARGRVWMGLVFKRMRQMGLEFNMTKQFFGSGGGEFLRVTYSSTDMTGLLWRSVSSFVVSPVDKHATVTNITKASSRRDHINTMRRRGLTLDGALVAWRLGVKRLIDHAIKVTGQTLSYAVFYKPLHQGGLDLGPPGTICNAVGLTTKPPTLTTTADELLSLGQSNMSDDWIAHISSIVKDSFDSQVIKQMMAADSFASSAAPESITRAMKHFESDFAKWVKSVQGDSSAEYVLKDVDLAKLQDLVAPRCEFVVCCVKTFERYLVNQDVGRDVEHYMGLGALFEKLAAQTPFGDIFKIGRGFHLGAQDARRMVFELAPDGYLKRRVASMLAHVERAGGQEAVSFFLAIPTLTENEWGAYLHPDVLGIVNCMSEYGMYDYYMRNYSQGLETAMNIGLYYANQIVFNLLTDERFVTLSKY